MKNWNETKARLASITINRSYIYLLYIFLGLPAMLYLLAVLLRDTGFGTTFGVLAHNYGLFVASPLPSFSTFSGVVGLAVSLWLTAQAVWRRDWLDTALCVIICTLNAAFYYFGLNYLLLQFIHVA